MPRHHQYDGMIVCPSPSLVYLLHTHDTCTMKVRRIRDFLELSLSDADVDAMLPRCIPTVLFSPSHFTHPLTLVSDSLHSFIHVLTYICTLAHTRTCEVNLLANIRWCKDTDTHTSCTRASCLPPDSRLARWRKISINFNPVVWGGAAGLWCHWYWALLCLCQWT